MELTGGQAMARQLALEGVEVVFGLPGVQLDYAVDGLASKAPEIRFIATRHEQATTYMADGYSRASGKPGVAMVVPGPGVLNSLAGIATAWASGSRVLLIAAQIPSPLIGQTRGVLHEIPDQTAVLRTLTKWTGLASRPEDVPGVVREGFAQLTSGRPRPVAVELPPDVLAGEGQVELATPVAAPPLPEPDGTLVERAARLLAEARFPVIHVGGGVISSGAAPAVVELAERLQAPILKSSFGHSAIDDRHPLVVPTQQSAAILGRADVVLVVGSRFLTRSGGTMPVREGARLVGLNLDRHDLGPPRAFDLELIGDARAGVSALLAALPSWWAPDGAAAEQRREAVAAARADAQADLEALEPQMSWVRALRAGLPDDGVVLNDLTQVGFVAELGFEARDPHSFVTAGYQGTLGYGFPTALGFKVGAPDRQVVALCGDGGFGYALQELSTARRERIGVTVMLFVDDWYGNVRRTQKEDFDGRFLGVTLGNPDFVALARAYGIEASRIDAPGDLTRILHERRGATDPALVVIPQGEVPSPWPQILWARKAAAAI